MRRAIVCMMIVFLPHVSINAGSLYHKSLSLPNELLLDNQAEADTPTIIIVGMTETEGKPIRHSKGISINGTRICEKMLSQSVLLLYPAPGARRGQPGL